MYRLPCHLGIDFPPGSHFDIIARQFESHSCGSPRPSRDGALSGKTITADAPSSEALNCFDFDHNSTPCGSSISVPFSTVNDSAVGHYGYSRKEFLSMTILDILPSEDVTALLREILQCRKEY